MSNVLASTHEELIAVLGGESLKISYASRPPTVVLMAGLQGSGKTTTTAKLGNYLRREGKKPLLVAADMQRPAAVEQLQILGKQIDIPVFNIPGATPLEICTKAVAEAMGPSKSLARRRFRLIQAKKRSTTQRRGRTVKPT